MKNTLTTLLFVFVLSALTAQIEYTDFGPNGLVVEMNENLAMDINNDGNTDFYINGHPNEIGFVPIFAFGCFTSPSSNSYTSFGARELTKHEVGDQIFLGSEMDYIEDIRGSFWNNQNEFAPGWENGTKGYIAFGVFYFGGVLDGWIEVELDTENERMIIHGLAYKDQASGNGVGIQVGDGVPDNDDDLLNSLTSSTSDLSDVITQVNVGPIPANESLNISFTYSAHEALNIDLIDMTGRKVYQHPFEYQTGETEFEIPLDRYSAGNYLLRMSSTEGVLTKKVSIVK